MIREINVSEITAAIKEMCIQANHFLSPDMDKALKAATANEESPLGKKILNQLQENPKSPLTADNFGIGKSNKIVLFSK